MTSEKFRQNFDPNEDFNKVFEGNYCTLFLIQSILLRNDSIKILLEVLEQLLSKVLLCFKNSQQNTSKSK